VTIPAWFLKRRVVRREDQARDTHAGRGPPPLLSVVVAHKQSGESATCSVPAGRDLDAPLVLARLVRGLWDQSLGALERRMLEDHLDKRTASADKTASPTVPAPEDRAVTEMFSILEGSRAADAIPGQTAPVLWSADDLALIKAATGLSHAMHATNLPPVARSMAMSKHTARLVKTLRRRAAAQARESDQPARLAPLVAAEIRATIAASLCSLPPATGDSFPSIKKNLILHAPTADHEDLVDQCLLSNAYELGSDVITLHAQDLAQLGGDYLGEGAEPSPRSIRSLGYETYRMNAELKNAFAPEVREATEDESEASTSTPSAIDSSATDTPTGSRTYTIPLSSFPPMMRSLLQGQSGFNIGAIGQFVASSNATNDDPRTQQNPSDTQLEDMKLTSLLEALIDADESKRNCGLFGRGSSQLADPSSYLDKPSTAPAFFDYSMSSDGAELELNSALPAAAKDTVNLVLTTVSASEAPKPSDRSKILHVKDFKELNATHYGGRIIEKLEEIVRKRRSSGERIMIVGSTCSSDLTPELSADGVHGLQYDGESTPYRTIFVTKAESSDSFRSLEKLSSLGFSLASADTNLTYTLSSPEMTKFQRINVLHIQDMLRSLDPVAATSISDMDQGSRNFHAWAPIFSPDYFYRVLTYDEVHRIALTALGLFVTDRANAIACEGIPNQVNWAHVALAIGLLEASDASKSAFVDTLEGPRRFQRSRRAEDTGLMGVVADQKFDEASLKRQRTLAEIATTATKYEKRLMSGIADPDQIQTTFDQVHVPKETVDSLRTITSLSLLRPEAFSYGILATEKISGSLLYGPPGTGKTMLAKAVAKESGSTVLEVSGSSIMEKYVGEGEKNVAAIFSLARKLSPCIVFLDEADAVFASRDAMRERTSHRDILNQFLKEWDGLNNTSVFVMVATNRPFDLDDAVIRRLPRRLLVDLPTQADRKEILRIHLAGEQLDDSVDLGNLATRTPFYSGSDLKNVAVSAALACVKEENEQAAIAAAKATSDGQFSCSAANSPIEATTSSPSSTTASSTPPTSPPQSPPHLVRGQAYKFPEKRTLYPRHFDKALQDISASISEDMSSLSAIKKFDEQYGDRKGNKRRKDFGFGMLSERNESAARVRM